MTKSYIIPGIVALLALAACAPPKTIIPNISQEALDAMGPGQDLTQVRRNRSGCYLIQSEDDLAGFLMPVRDVFGENVCDEQ